MSINITVRCTPFCRPCSRGYKHHDLLLALLNMGKTPKEREHDHLARMIKRHEASGWDKNTAILEKNDEYRFPLLHWACVLGMPRTVQWLLDNGFSPTVQSSLTKETAVHRILLTLPELANCKAGRQSVFEAMLPSLRGCLSIGDHRQDTPLHVAAKLMVQNKSFTLYEKLMTSLVLETGKMPAEEQRTILNAINSTGDTVLHILASTNRSLYSIQLLVDAGSDPLLTNKLSISPLDIAVKNCAYSIINLLKTCLLEGCWNDKPKSRVSSVNEDTGKRRSERRCSASLTTWSEKKLDTSMSSSGSLDSTPLSQSVLQHDEHVDADIEKVTSSNLADTVKEEPFEICQCDTDDAIAVTSGEEDGAIGDHDEHSKGNADLPLLEMIEKAGVFQNIGGLIKNTRNKHASKLEEVQKSLKETEKELDKQKEKQVAIQEDIIQMRKELELRAAALSQTRADKDKMLKKRKLLEDESDELKKKMLCCETLLKNVPGDADG